MGGSLRGAANMPPHGGASKRSHRDVDVRTGDATPASAAGLFELRVDDAAVLAALLGRSVHDAGEAVRFLLEARAHVLHLRVVLLLDGLAPFLDERFERREILTLD